MTHSSVWLITTPLETACVSLCINVRWSGGCRNKTLWFCLSWVSHPANQTNKKNRLGEHKHMPASVKPDRQTALADCERTVTFLTFTTQRDLTRHNWSQTQRSSGHMAPKHKRGNFFLNAEVYIKAYIWPVWQAELNLFIAGRALIVCLPKYWKEDKKHTIDRKRRF